MRTLRWVLMNGLMLGGLVAGLVYGIDGARNVGLFMVWFCFVGSWGVFSEDLQKEVAKENKPPAVPPWIDGMLDSSVVVLLVWHSLWISAVAYTLHILFLAHLRRKVGEIRKATP